MNEVQSLEPQKPVWRQIADFPLVAMVIAVALFILATAGATLISKLLPPMAPNVARAVKGVVGIGLMLAFYKLVIVRLGERPRDDLPFAAAPRGLGIGIAIGFLLFCALVGIAALFDVYNIVGPGDARELVKDLIGMTIVAAFMEELLFRGILFRFVEEFAGSWAALIVTSALFGLAHIFNANATWISSLAIMVEAGALLGGAYLLARNLWVPMGLHAAWNFTQGFIFDVPVSGMDMHGLVQAKLSGPVLLSGGTFGLEASMIGVVLSIPLGAALIMVAARRGHIVRPMWRRSRPYCAVEV
jgi:membrane protease YdiL (CAAX protease family)